MSESWEQYVPHLYQFALRLCRDAHLAEDLTQETLLRAWDRRRQLRQPTCLRAWLFRIVVNLWRDHCRRAVLREGKQCDLPANPPSPASVDPATSAAMRDDVRLVLAALEGLPPRQREVLHLAACEDMSLAEIAEVLDISTAAAKANLSAARKQMRDRLRGKLS